jgi:hypothetical protein
MSLRKAAAAMALLLLPACGLPLPDGVQSAGEVRAEREEPPPFQVIPPGPQPGATPEDVVRGFLAALCCPQGDHAVAREFLAPGTPWDNEQGAVIYRNRRFVTDTDSDPLTFAVRFETEARISPAGAFSLDSVPVVEQYRVAQLPDGEFRLAEVPEELFVLRQDRDRSFTPHDVFYFARSIGGAHTSRLVPQRVFLPSTAKPAPALVESLLSRPAGPLQGAVQSTLPFELEAVSVDESEGVIVVDLPEQARQLSQAERQRLSAQFVWTLLPLQAFSGVRLLAGGRPYDVKGVGEVQTRDDWSEFDPDGVSPRAPLHYVRDRVLRSIDGTLPQSEATLPQGLDVDEVAVSPASSALGLLTRSAEGLDEVRTGPPQGPFGGPVLAKPRLGSLSWGPGEQGLWVLESGPSPLIWLVPGPGTEVQRNQPVLYQQPTDAGLLTSLRVSRDGARVALIFGAGEAARLYVGTVEPAGQGLRVSAVTPVAPGLTSVTDVAWQDGSTLVVLATSATVDSVLVWRVTVDGSTTPPVVQRPGLEGTPVSIAAAPGRPLVVATRVEDEPRLYQDNGQVFLEVKEARRGAAPAYPG